MAKTFGLPVETPAYSGRVHPSYNQAGLIGLFEDSHQLLLDPEAEILQRGRNLVGAVIVSAPETGPLDVVIKEFSPRGIDRIKGRVLPSKALRAWRGAGALVHLGIGTPEPILYLEEKHRPAGRSYYISLRLRDVKEIRGLFLSGSETVLGPFLHRLAGALRLWHRRGILHRDLSDGNILLGDGEKELRFYLTDTNRIRVLSSIGAFRGIKNLIRLGVPEPLQKAFLGSYLDKEPVPRRHWLWYRLAKKSFTAYLRLKKILRVKTIARKLGIQ
jgi:hypothetical protein